MRCRISAAAASVNVTSKISSSDTGGVSTSSKFTQRSTSVRVLPVPAPALTNTLPRASMACCCWAVNFMQKSLPGSSRREVALTSRLE